MVKKESQTSKETKEVISVDIKAKKEPKWNDNIKSESLEKALKAGIILPQFKPYKNTVYTIILLSEPKFVDNEKGKFHVIDIEKDNMKYTLNMNESFKFQLALLLKRNEADLSTLIKGNVPLHISKDENGYFSIQKV